MANEDIVVTDADLAAAGISVVGTDTGEDSGSGSGSDSLSWSSQGSTHDSTCIGVASLVLKSADGNYVGHVKSMTDNDIAKIQTMISDVTNLDSAVTDLENRIIISSESPSGGTAGQLWFKYEA